MPERYQNKAPIPVYHDGIRCPACTGSHWFIGRLLAECAKCNYPLILNEQGRSK